MVILISQAELIVKLLYRRMLRGKLAAKPVICADGLRTLLVGMIGPLLAS